MNIQIICAPKMFTAFNFAIPHDECIVFLLNFINYIQFLLNTKLTLTSAIH